MICPKCNKAELKEHISIGKSLFCYKKEVTSFCPICEFQSKKQFKISEEDARIENEIRLNLPKEIVQTYKRRIE